MMSPVKSQQGFSLIEALISILVVALGLLGALGMIVNSLKLTSSSNYRTIAAQQAYSMAEQLRANPLALAATALGADSYDSVIPNNPASAPTVINSDCLKSAGCAVDARKNYITASAVIWQQQLAAVMPGGMGTICRDANPNTNVPTQSAAGAVTAWNCSGTGEYVVKVCWNEARIGASTQGASGLGAGGLLCTWTGL